MAKSLYILMIILLSYAVTANNNIYQFDENSDIILTTSVYKNGLPYDAATCNLTIFNPPPNEDTVNLTDYMQNRGQGIYAINLTGRIGYNDEIYPLTLYCNDSTGIAGFDERIGIKIGEKLYDYIIPGITLLCIAFLFVYMSFKLQDPHLKMLTFYLGLVFVLCSLVYGMVVVGTIPSSGGITTLYQVIITIFIVIVALLLILQWVDKLNIVSKMFTGNK